MTIYDKVKDRMKNFKKGSKIGLFRNGTENINYKFIKTSVDDILVEIVPNNSNFGQKGVSFDIIVTEGETSKTLHTEKNIFKTLIHIKSEKNKTKKRWLS